jgi:3-oxoacyl-[acyl-carrier-protein] synthase-1
MTACVVTVRGMVSSLGGVVTGCAALRAGISRPRAVRGVPVLRLSDQEPIPLIGHPVHGITDGFPAATRWVRLAAAAFADFLEQPSAPTRDDRGFWSRAGVVAVLPRLQDTRFQSEDIDCGQVLQDAVLAPLRRALAIPVEAAQVEAVEFGHAGSAAALVLAKQRIAAGAWDAALIIAVDSYLDGLSLEWLGGSARLKSDDQPCGLSPGEAGVCVLVENAAVAAARGAPAVAAVVGAAAGPGAPPRPAGPESGKAIAAQFAAAWSEGGVAGGFSGAVISDHNGESWRGHELALGLQRLRERRLLATERLLLPASSLGDTGAASGAVALCFAAHLFTRDPGAGALTAVISQGERGESGVAFLARVP